MTNVRRWIGQNRNRRAEHADLCSALRNLLPHLNTVRFVFCGSAPTSSRSEYGPSAWPSDGWYSSRRTRCCYLPRPSPQDLLQASSQRPIGGAVADRFPRNRLLLLTAIIRAISILLIALVALSGFSNPWPIFVIGRVRRRNQLLRHACQAGPNHRHRAARGANERHISPLCRHSICSGCRITRKRNHRRICRHSGGTVRRVRIDTHRWRDRVVRSGRCDQPRGWHAPH